MESGRERRHGLKLWPPVPGQQLIEPARGMAGDAREDVGEPRLRIAADPAPRGGYPVSSGRFQIYLCLTYFAEEGIGLLLLLKRLIEEGRSIVHSKLPGPCFQGPVTRHFIVLDGLTAGEETCVEGFGSRIFFHDLVALPPWAAAT
jgi:hypothetical protein